ncbi:MAG: polysaccharide biosynthesis/export family protein [Phenylobacterium sp.]|uniref:polysaccharide biosynthesis/export family protein n=1 Tax=Phenylobacterium sp. TaxID=1871053 RepID=UPI002718D88E|nr:polysaccharide biosynthesis/export family protein [Phenylobacterium sp.]MDO8900102.1 polysaccharide biosynthesis/export family protein [Phenylobacterium sp.]MDP2213610.1 polysaccharide biosynthesis/export family protein [Phenylobacterium sp.]
MLIDRRFRAPIGLSMALALAACGGARSVPGASLVGLGEPQHQTQFANIPYAQWTDYEPAYRFYPGDEIEVVVPSAPELTRTVTVQPDGRITVPLIPPIMAADRTTLQLEAALSQAYSAHLLRPDVFVTAKAAPLKVFVGGEVGAPGVYDMQGDADALRAVIQAGGFRTTADRSKVIIIRRGADGQGMMRTTDLLAGLRRPSADLVPLRRFDIIYVPRSGVANAGLFVQQYFRDLSPIQFGFSYALNEAGVN